MLNALLLLTTFSGIAMAISFSLLLPEARCFATVGRDSLVFYALNDIVLKTVKFALFSVAHIPVATLPFAEQLYWNPGAHHGDDDLLRSQRFCSTIYALGYRRF